MWLGRLGFTHTLYRRQHGYSGEQKRESTDCLPTTPAMAGAVGITFIMTKCGAEGVLSWRNLYPLPPGIGRELEGISLITSKYRVKTHTPASA